MVVSHSLGSVQAMCDEVAWLDHGRAAGHRRRPATSSTSTSRRCTRIASAEEHATGSRLGIRGGSARAARGARRATAGPPTTSAPARRSPSGCTTTPRSPSSAPPSRWRSTRSRACCSRARHASEAGLTPDQHRGPGDRRPRRRPAAAAPRHLRPVGHRRGRRRRCTSTTTATGRCASTSSPATPARASVASSRCTAAGSTSSTSPARCSTAADGRAPRQAPGHRAARPRRRRRHRHRLRPEHGGRPERQDGGRAGRAPRAPPTWPPEPPRDYLAFVPAGVSWPEGHLERCIAPPARRPVRRDGRRLRQRGARRRPRAVRPVRGVRWSATAPSTPWRASTRAFAVLDRRRLRLAAVAARATGCAAPVRRRRASSPRPAPADELDGGRPLVLASRPRRHEPRRRRLVARRRARPPAAAAAGRRLVIQRSRAARRRRAAPARPCRRGPLGGPRRRTPRRWPRSSAPGVRPSAPGARRRIAVVTSDTLAPADGRARHPCPADRPAARRRPRGGAGDHRALRAPGDGVRGRPGRGEGPARPRAMVRRLPVPGLGDGRARLPGGPRTRWSIADVYDPMHLEQLEQGHDAEGERGRFDAVRNASAVLNEQLAGPTSCCAPAPSSATSGSASWPAWAASTPSSTTATSRCARLLAVVPFGVGDEPPVATRSRDPRRRCPGIGPDDKVDPLGRRGLQLVRPAHARPGRRPPPRSGSRPCGCSSSACGTPTRASRRCAWPSRPSAWREELGLVDSHVFFNQDWVAFEDRQNYLLDADVGVSTHLDHIETEFSFRTRILDYLWAGLPIVATDGDSFAEVIVREDLGLVVPARRRRGPRGRPGSPPRRPGPGRGVPAQHPAGDPRHAVGDGARTARGVLRGADPSPRRVLSGPPAAGSGRADPAGVATRTPTVALQFVRAGASGLLVRRALDRLRRYRG